MHTKIRPIFQQYRLSFWLPVLARRDTDGTDKTTQANQTAETCANAKTYETTKARAVAETDQEAETCTDAQTDTKGVLRIVTTAALSRVRVPERHTTLKERLTRFMYPIHLIERVVNYLGVVGILSVVAGCVMGSMGKAVPDMIIFAAGTAIGALAGIAQATHAKDNDTRSIGGIHVQHADGEVMETLKQIMEQLQDHAKRIREQEAA